jgi:hypothetical protein
MPRKGTTSIRKRKAPIDDGAEFSVIQIPPPAQKKLYATQISKYDGDLIRLKSDGHSPSEISKILKTTYGLADKVMNPKKVSSRFFFINNK